MVVPVATIGREGEGGDQEVSAASVGNWGYYEPCLVQHRMI